MLNILSRRAETIQLPYNLTAETMYVLIDQVVDQNHDVRFKRIEFDFNKLHWIDPVGVAVLSNLIEFLKRSNVRIGYAGYAMNDVNKDSIKYLDDSGFFKQYLGKCLNSKASLRSTTIPLGLVSHQRSFAWIDSELMPWMADKVGLKQPSLASIKVCFQEIFNNINDHSTVDVGCICGQFFPRKDSINIVLSDFGIGIPANVRKLHPEMEDHECIKLATQEGFTTRTGRNNRGAGLDILIKNLVKHNKGVLVIHSRKGTLTCSRDAGGEVKKVARLGSQFYPGTLLLCNFRTDTFEELDLDDEVFEWT